MQKKETQLSQPGFEGNKMEQFETNLIDAIKKKSDDVSSSSSSSIEGE